MMDDTLILLSTIKDDDHLAAYKVSKFEKNVIYLQLVHHCRGQYVLYLSCDQLVNAHFYCFMGNMINILLVLH